MIHKNPLEPSIGETTIRLSESPVGMKTHLEATRLPIDEGALLEAMGLVPWCEIQILKQGEPVIIDVGATRIGLSRTVAEKIFVRGGRTAFDLTPNVRG